MDELLLKCFSYSVLQAVVSQTRGDSFVGVWRETAL